MRKKHVALLAGVGLSASLVGVSSGALIAYDPMNYTAGSFADGTATTGAGFSGNWSIKDTGNNPATATVVSGLTYPGLPTADNAMQHASGTGRRELDPLAIPISSTSGSSPGTTWISFLIQDGGDSGGVPIGVVLDGDQSTSLFAGFDGGATLTQTKFGLGNIISGTTASGGNPSNFTAFGATDNIFNTTTHLIVLELQYTGTNTATVSEYVDPTAGVSTPPSGSTGNPNDVTGSGGASGLIQTVTGVTVGTISSIGTDGAGGTSVTLDEVRVGDSFGDVVGAPVPEPASLGILGLGAYGLLLRRRSPRES